jgi:hypothetical protein
MKLSLSEGRVIARSASDEAIHARALYAAGLPSARSDGRGEASQMHAQEIRLGLRPWTPRGKEVKT